MHACNSHILTTSLLCLSCSTVHGPWTLVFPKAKAKGPTLARILGKCRVLKVSLSRLHYSLFDNFFIRE
ncbi:hypothetical protein KP509_27G055300 [Ceratopteris richardii]|uniref:Secreted protein n=1 Tax=Ceratopteris richardii TaxID=49495 RepID=A0A8T2RGP6_CERRI|nr:hypothetical protein KP509_27G055300 [Ceratopteris richardii]